jgi:hypothetical protein
MLSWSKEPISGRGWENKSSKGRLNWISDPGPFTEDRAPLNPLRSFPSHWRHDEFFSKVLYIAGCLYTVTRPYAGFRHPDWMLPDHTFREGKHFVHRPCWYCTFLHSGRHFCNFHEIYPVKKRNVLRICFYLLLVLILSYTPRPRLPCKRVQNMKY